MYDLKHSRLVLSIVIVIMCGCLLSSCRTDETLTQPVSTIPAQTGEITTSTPSPTSTTPKLTSHTPAVTAAEGFYIYPVQPGSPEWDKLATLDEKITACQVPEDILQQLSTKALIDTILTYPLLDHEVFYGDPASGLLENFSHANCVQELYTRADAAAELLAHYLWMLRVEIDERWTYSIKMKYTIKIRAVETLWEQTPIQEQTTPEQRSSFNREKKDKILRIQLFGFVLAGGV
jgi:hypothetical protein